MYIFKLLSTALLFSQRNTLKGTHFLYALNDTAYEPLPHQWVGTIEYGVHILYGAPPEKAVLFTKDFKYDKTRNFMDGFIVRLIPQSELQSLPYVPTCATQVKYDREIAVTLSGCDKDTNVLEIIDKVAEKDDVFYVYERTRVKLQSLSSRAQFHGKSSRHVHNNGTRYTGKGSVVVFTDSFIDESHGAFYHASEPLVEFYDTITGHSKIIVILSGNVVGKQKRTVRESESHGTKIVSEAIGNQWLTESGVAPAARLVYIELLKDEQERFFLPLKYTQSLETAYQFGARSGALSWTTNDENGEYSALAYQLDTFLYTHPDFALAITTGNKEKLSSVTNIKMAMSVGASYGNDKDEYPIAGNASFFDSLDAAEFTSFGTTANGRKVPVLLAPGVHTRGARSRKVPYPSHESMFSTDGGSSSVATIVGEYALIDEKYSTGVTRMLKNALLVAFANRPKRVIDYKLPEIVSIKTEHPLLTHTLGVPIMREFDTARPFVQDKIHYNGNVPTVFEGCLKLDQPQVTRVVISWNDPSTTSGKVMYPLHLVVITDEEVRSSFDPSSVLQFVDVSGKTLRIRVYSPIVKRHGRKLLFAIATNVTATVVSCEGSCFPEKEEMSCNNEEESRHCLHNGVHSPCVKTRCKEGYYGPNCTLTSQKPPPTCDILNGYGSRHLGECVPYECKNGFFLSTNSSCVCPIGGTIWCEYQHRLGICVDSMSYECEPKAQVQRELEQRSLASCALNDNNSPIFPVIFTLSVCFFVFCLDVIIH